MSKIDRLNKRKHRALKGATLPGIFRVKQFFCSRCEKSWSRMSWVCPVCKTDIHTTTLR